MVHINPRVSLGFPSAMSSFLMLTSLTWGNKATSSRDKELPFVWFGQVLKGVQGSRRHIFTGHTCRCLRKSSAICTFCSLWNRMRPFSLGCGGEDRDKEVFSYMADTRESCWYTYCKGQGKAFNQKREINGEENQMERHLTERTSVGITSESWIFFKHFDL